MWSCKDAEISSNSINDQGTICFLSGLRCVRIDERRRFLDNCSLLFPRANVSTMKRTASELDADEARVPSKRPRGLGPKPTSDGSATNKRERTPKREVEAAGKAFSKLELAYPLKGQSSGNSGPQIPFQQPTPLTTFSYNSKRELRFDDSALRYYVDPPNGADLRHGYERWVKRPEEKGRLDGLLKAWVKVRNDFPDGFMNGGVIAWRGVMTRYVKALDRPCGLDDIYGLGENSDSPI